MGLRRFDTGAAVASRAHLVSQFLQLDLHPIHDPQFHVFPAPGGITGFVMLSESHLACHTYPEHGVLTINLYCCRPRPEWAWSERLAEIVGATNVDVREVTRATRELVTCR